VKKLFLFSAAFSLALLACGDDASSTSPENISDTGSQVEQPESSGGEPEVSSSSEAAVSSSDASLSSAAETSSSSDAPLSSAAETSSSSDVPLSSTAETSSSSVKESSSSVAESSSSAVAKGGVSNILFIGDRLLFGKSLGAYVLDEGRVVYYLKDSIMVETESQPTTLDYHGVGVDSPDKDFYGYIKKAYREQNKEYTFYRAGFYNSTWEDGAYDSLVGQRWFKNYIHKQLSDKTDAVVIQVESFYYRNTIDENARTGTEEDTSSMIVVMDSIKAVAPRAKIIWVGQWSSEHFQFIGRYGARYVPISQLRRKDTGSPWEKCLESPDQYPYSLTCNYTCDDDPCPEVYLKNLADSPNELGYKLIAEEILKALNETTP